MNKISLIILFTLTIVLLKTYFLHVKKKKITFTQLTSKVKQLDLKVVVSS